MTHRPRTTRNAMLPAALTGLALALAGLNASAGKGAQAAAAEEPLELSEAEVFLELNDTDGDLGLHASIDGGPYTLLEIEDPRERTILRMYAGGALARQGLTQFFIESAEPTFDELPPERFFERFPAGRYEVSISRDGQELEKSVRLSHVLAAPPSDVTVSRQHAAENCDAELLPVVAAPVVIDWEPVTTSHPDIGARGPVEISRYQFFVEQGDVKLAVDLPPTVTEFEVPASISSLGGTFKFEIIARTKTGNNTAVESCYVVVQ